MRRLILVGYALLILVACAIGQSPDTPAQRGIQPNSVYSTSDLDAVNLRSGNLSLQIPLASLPPGPGGSAMQIGLSYNSQIYDLIPLISGSQTEKLVPSTTGGGWRYNYQYSLFEDQRAWSDGGTGPDCTTGDTQHQYKQYMVFPDGSRHLLRMDVYSNLPANTTLPGYGTPSSDDYNLYNVDGVANCTGYPQMVSRPVLYTDDGTYVRVVTQRIYQFIGTVTVYLGSSATATTVTLSATGVLPGWVVTFTGNQVGFNTNGLGYSTITVTPPPNVSSGTYRIGIVGTAGSVQSTTAVFVQIPGGILSPDSVSLPSQAQSNYHVSPLISGIASGFSSPPWINNVSHTCSQCGLFYSVDANSGTAREGTIQMQFPPGLPASLNVRQEATVPSAGFGLSASGETSRTLAWTAYFPNGQTVDGVWGQTSKITDRNGNAISITGRFDPYGMAGPEVIVADSANRRVRIVYQVPAVGLAATDVVTREYCSSTTLCGPTDVHWQANQTSQVDWQEYQGDFNSKRYPCGSTFNGTACAFTPRGTYVKTITLPLAVNGESPLAYRFTYNTESTTKGWGELQQVTTPGGYVATYSYQFDSVGDRGTTGVPVMWNPVTKKIGSDSETWSYNACPAGFNCTASVTASDGGTRQTYYTALEGFPWKTQEPNSDIIERLWYKNRPPNTCGVAAAPQCGNPYVKTEYRTIQTTSGPKLASIRDYTYDKNDNIRSLDEYDCLAAACGTIPRDGDMVPTGLPSGTVARHTEFTYATNTTIADAGTGDPLSGQADAYWSSAAPRLLTAKKTLKVTGISGSGDPRYVEYSYDNERGSGNLTQQLDYDSTRAASLTPPLIQGTNAIRSFSATYDGNGNLLTRLDANGTSTRYEYGSESCMNSYPTAINLSDGLPETLRTTQTWFCQSGLQHTSTDPNLVVTTLLYDVLDRVSSVTEGTVPDQRTTSTTYSDTNRTVTMVAPFDTGHSLTTIQTYDSRGRLISTNLPNGVCSQATVEHRYLIPSSTDTTSYGFSYELISNPYCSSTTDTTMGWTRTKRDPNGRLVETAFYSGSTAPAPWPTGNGATLTGASVTSYNGDQITSQDPALVSRRSRFDGLGRLVEVVEDPNGMAYSTTYGYDLRDALTSVTQTRKAGVTNTQQVRSFNYSSLGRLRSATNVESGTTSYTYDDNGNLHTTQLANGASRTYQYNSRNQLKSKTYSLANTPSVVYCYDGQVPSGTDLSCVAPTAPIAYPKGRLTGTWSSAAMSRYTGYDWLGRILSSEQWVDGQIYPFAYRYLLGGQLSYLRYPSGRELVYSYNNAGQPLAANGIGPIGGVLGPTPYYATGVAYAPHGGIQSGTFGPLTQSLVYNPRLQLTSVSAARAGTTLWKLTNTYPAIQNNGNMSSQTVDASGGGGINVTANFSYDTLNRLTGSTEGGAGVSQGYGYDSVGNRWVSSGYTPSTSFTPTSAGWFDGGTNRIVNSMIQNDPGGTGNVTGMGSYVLEYDAENRMKKSTIGSAVTEYWYDGDGRRVKKLTGGLPQTVFVYDARGELAAEYGASLPKNDVQYVVQDPLGSTRLVTDRNGAVEALHDYLPFGEEIPAGVGGRIGPYAGSDGVTHKFTDAARDAETASSASQGLDYFGARYFSGAQGRFTTPDPLMASARASNPQTWNRYAHTLNNPLRYVDPDGMDVPAECAKDPNCTIKVKVNVIYDQTANHGKGLTAAQKKGIEQGQIAKAQKDYGTSNIKLDVSYTAGSYTVDQNTGKMQLSGLQSDALNVMVSTGTPNGAAGVSGVDRNTGTAVTFLNVNDVVDTNKAYPFLTNTTEHELAHQFLGHPFLPEPNFLQYFGREMESDARVKVQANGISQTGFREGLEPRRYAVPLNPEANKPRQ